MTVTSTLTITEVRYNDRGRYSCTAYNSLTTISHTDTAESLLNVNRKSTIMMCMTKFTFGPYSETSNNFFYTLTHPSFLFSSLPLPAMIRIESEDLTSNNVVLVSFGTSLVIECFGSGNLVWTTPPSQSVFTSYNSFRNILTLSIPNFITPDRYTCSSDLDPGLKKSILITTHGTVCILFMG